ncbi:MAG: hypothetical protein IT435_13380 [Phycisphaerales bacterium]|nr:hypothetical protein [Phycisphaerales bacterium]
MSPRSRHIRTLLPLSILILIPAQTFAQVPQPSSTNPSSPPPASPSADPGDDSFITDQDLRKRKADMERELKKLRVKHFGSMRKVEIRQEGIAKLRTYTDPLIYPALVSIFEREQHDVRLAILDHLMDQQTEEGDVTIAWIAAFDRDEVIRQEALDRVRQRIAGQPVPQKIKYMIYQALRSGSPEKMDGAARLAESLSLFEAIPWLITAQFGGPGGGGGAVAEPRGDLAYIVIGNQTAFVSDLTPIVSDSAVAFDPTLSTLTTGVILRIQDAVVTTHRTIIHTVLVGMSSDAWGRSTEGLGYDGPGWWQWYRDEYLPHIGAKLASEEAQGTPEPTPTPTSTPVPTPDPMPVQPPTDHAPPTPR